MSQPLINRSPDLKRLQDEGYSMEIRGGHLVVHSIPYVDSQRQVRLGKLVCPLTLAGDRTQKPEDHVMHFAGDHPCDDKGQELAKIKHQSVNQVVDQNLSTQHSFSSKPEGGYPDYYEKVRTYATIISGYAQALQPTATPTPYLPIVAEAPECVFNYVDTASSRAQISGINQKLEKVRRLAIIGLGGTGAYVLDLVVKTRVGEIHLFDGDVLRQHNAFRGPGAPSLDDLRRAPKKVEFYRDQYAPLRRNLVAHDCFIDESTVEQLKGMDFVFICVDSGSVKKLIFRKLEEFGVPFIDVGMGLELHEETGSLTGLVRVTTSTPESRNHVWEKPLVSFADDHDGIYSRNIQVADLNSLNATLAVIKWKRLYGVYLDLEHEHQSVYTLDGNTLFNSEQFEDEG